MTITPDRLAVLDTITLDAGSHSSFAAGHCAMEVVAFLAGEGHTDAPSCASPVLRRFTITLNDRWDKERRQALKPYLPRMVGTAGDGKDTLREEIAIRGAAELLVPWFRLAGLDTEADQVVAHSTPDTPAPVLRRVLREAADAAWRQRAARYAELRAKIRAQLPAVAVAVAAAVAAAVAVADAAASVPPGEDRWDRVYRAVRKHFKDNPLDLGPVHELSASQDGAGLALLERLIDPAA